MKFEPMAFLLVAVPLLTGVVLGFKTPADNTLFSIMIFVDLFVIAYFVAKKVGATLFEKIANKELDDECYNKLLETVAILRGLCPFKKTEEEKCCCCSLDFKNPKKLMIFVTSMMLISLVTYIFPLRWISLLAYVVLISTVVYKKL